MKKLFLLASLAFSLNAIAQLPAYVPTNGLVGWWPFNGNAIDESVNANDGTVNGATLTTDRFGNANSAYSFNGSNSFINVPNSATLQFNGGITISAWINAASFPSPVSYWFSKGSDGVVPYAWTSSIDASGSGGVCMWNNISQNSCASFTANVSTNQWYNIVSTYDGSFARLYVNGQLKSSTASTYTVFTNTSDLKFGRMGHPTGNWPYFWSGKLDDFGVWNRALTQQEITGLYNGTTTTCTDTVHVTVTDTLIINRTMTNLNPLTYQNTIKIYPNPANNVLNMNFGNSYSALNGYTLKITNSLSQTVYITPINSQNTNVNISPWANGIYFVHLIDASNNTVDIKKIVIQ